MPAAYTELFLDQGTDFTTTLTVDDISGNLYDLDNYQIKSQIKKSYYTHTVVATFDVSTPNTSTGIVILSLDSANTANIAAGRYVYDVLMKDTANNTTSRILEGIVNVSPGVTIF